MEKKNLIKNVNRKSIFFPIITNRLVVSICFKIFINFSHPLKCNRRPAKLTISSIWNHKYFYLHLHITSCFKYFYITSTQFIPLYGKKNWRKKETRTRSMYERNSETIKNSWNYGLFYAPRQQCRIAYKLCTLFYFIASRESGIMFYTRSYPLILYKPLNWKSISFRKNFRNTYMSNTLYLGCE